MVPAKAAPPLPGDDFSQHVADELVRTNVVHVLTDRHHKQQRPKLI